MTENVPPVVDQLDQWRAYLASRDGVSPDDIAELTDHLESQMDDLTARGLAPDEAFMVAVKRIGRQSALAADFARENASAFWKQMVLDGGDPERGRDRAGLWPMLGFAVAAGLVLVAVVRWGVQAPDNSIPTLAVEAFLGVFGVLVAWFSWLRRPSRLLGIGAAAGAALLLGVATLWYPFIPAGSAEAVSYDTEFLGVAGTQMLAMIHLPIALLVLLGIAYLGDDWRTVLRWMDYLRFVGEWLIYLALIALGAMVLFGLAFGIFALVGVDPSTVLLEWVLPAGLGGALVVAAWLVEAKKSVVENMAPVLTAVFTPLFTALLVALFIAMLAVGNLGRADRELLILVDLLLVVVWGLVLFSTSARAEGAKPRVFDWLQLTLLVSALAVDVLVLAVMAGRIGEFGASPNKLAALGENLVIAVNLAGALWLQVGFLRGLRTIEALRLWQCRYLPVVGAWAAVVVLLFPPVFGFR